MDYRKKIWAAGLISVLFIIGALLVNVNSIKDSMAQHSQNAQETSQSEYDFQENNDTNYENQNEENQENAGDIDGIDSADSQDRIQEPVPESNWFQEYDKTSQDIIKKYSTPKNYLTNAANTKGQIVKWGKRNLKVYIEDGAHKNTVLRGVTEFSTVFSDIFAISVIDDKNLSDIEVVFQARPNANPKSLELGITFPQYDNNGIIQKSHIALYTQHPITQQALTEAEIYSTFLHEMGHAVGVVGHSQESGDLMYASSSRKTYSERDIATIKAIYSTSEISSDTKQQIAANKLTEAQNYAQKYPKEGGAWISLAQTYYAQNNYAKAAEAYKAAIKISPNDVNIYIGLASCYYASKKYDEAIECLQYAKSLNLDKYQEKRITELLSYNYNAKGDLDNGYFYTKEALDANPYDKTNLGNFLIICAKTDRKLEAKTSLANYLQAKPEDRNDPALKDFANAFNL